MTEYAAPRGTRDILPDETPKWEYLEKKFRQTCALYGYRELRTPTFEHTELFTRSLGETTDVVSKEMYTFESRGGKSLTLRPEGTAPAIRAYVQHNLAANLPVTKLYYIGRLFRYERPQAGRYREHTQLGIEAVGSCDPAIDAEIIALAVQFYNSIGLTQFDLKLNSIGCPICRPNYRRALLDYVADRRDTLCAPCNERYEVNPMRMLDCKVETCKQALKDAPKIPDYLGEECSKHFAAVQDYLTKLGISYTLDPDMVRGFDYYTRTAFEFVASGLGAQDAIGGGGRYDDMVEQFGGKPTPAMGFGLGLDRLVLSLDAMGISIPVNSGITAFIATMGEPAHNAAVELLARLRKEGISADMDYTGRSLKAQMKTANKLNAKYAIILGEDELKKSVATVRDMAGSDQKTVSLEDLPNALLPDDR